MTCAKKIVTCTIQTPDGHVFVGRNDCDNPQDVCPRAPGEGYQKCKDICKQPGHAEEVALKNAEGHDLTESTAYIDGIGYYCKECQLKLFAAGVKALCRA